MQKKTSERLITASSLLWAAVAPAYLGILVYDARTYDLITMESTLKFFSPINASSAVEIPAMLAWIAAGAMLSVIQHSQIQKHQLNPKLSIECLAKAKWLWSKVGRKAKAA